MDIIHLLPDSVANQIAAGEVIQRPASCLKELVENSLDAGATHIHVIVRDAGRTLLQVVDNGSGMSETDARMAFERHATSKISDANDLFALRTMGFRGEALASICAVAHVEVQTRRQEDEVGTLLEIAGSDVIRQEPCQCPVGTNFKVKNLFYNIPVRRKFLKTDQTELRNLLTEFYHIVLVYPAVQFTFVSNDEVLLDLPAGTHKQRIEAIYGKSNSRTTYTSQFVDIKADTEMATISGFIGKPETAGKNPQQYFFVNGRFMNHPYFKKAILTAYSGMLPSDYAPSYFIYFDMDPATIDVNIHPTKTEIKFADEQAIFQILLATIREALGKFNLTPPLDFNREGEIEMPLFQAATVAAPEVMVNPDYNPFRSTAPSQYVPSAHSAGGYEQTTIPSHWDRLFAPRESELADVQTELLPDIEVQDPHLSQYADKYIIMPTNVGLCIVNQHRAHALIIYNELLQQISQQKGISQQVLFPDVIDLSTDEMVLLTSIREDLQQVGFELEQLSRNSYSVQGVPAILADKNSLLVLQRLIGLARENKGGAQQGFAQIVAREIASQAAIPYGRSLTEEEMRDLVNRLFALPSYRKTPDGKNVLFLLTDEEINKHF